MSPVSRRSFVASAVGFATTFQLTRAARALGFAPDTTVCRLMPEQEVGPFYVAGEMLRSDIREGKPGVPLSLSIAVLDARTCQPLPGAAIDLWHCDAMGLYSGFTKSPMNGPGGPAGPGGQSGPPPGFDPEHAGPPPDFHPPDKNGGYNGPPDRGGPPHENKPTDQLTFLRGVQLTSPNGSVHFETVFPGFYPGRTNHVHFKVRVGGQTATRENSGQTYAAGHTSHVGQVFFPEELCLELMQHEPYSKHAIHRTTQQQDMVFRGQHGELAIAKIQWIDPADHAKGLHAEAIAAVDPTATPRGVGPGTP